MCYNETKIVMSKIEIKSLDHIDEAAKEFLLRIGDHKKIAFSGEMGIGKTTFIQAICRELGVDTVVNSPTFALINEYFTREGESIYHFDLYRIENIEEMYDFGYEDYVYSDSWCFIEWPEKAMELMPEDTLMVKLYLGEKEERIVLFD